MPAGAATSSEQPVEFKPLPKDISAHIIDVGYLAGRSLFARDPKRASSKDEYPHRLVHVRYEFRAGKLFPGKVQNDEN